jgi:hypothetical protein
MGVLKEKESRIPWTFSLRLLKQYKYVALKDNMFIFFFRYTYLNPAPGFYRRGLTPSWCLSVVFYYCGHALFAVFSVLTDRIEKSKRGGLYRPILNWKFVQFGKKLLIPTTNPTAQAKNASIFKFLPQIMQ